MRNLSEHGGPGKLRAYWEDQIHVVVERKGKSPVYELKPERGNGKKRVLHRNLQLPCDFLPVTEERNGQRGERTWNTVPHSSTDSNSDDGDPPTYSPLQLSEWPESNPATDGMQLLTLLSPETMNPQGHNIQIPWRTATTSLSQEMLLRKNRVQTTSYNRNQTYHRSSRQIQSRIQNRHLNQS